MTDPKDAGPEALEVATALSIAVYNCLEQGLDKDDMIAVMDQTIVEHQA